MQDLNEKELKEIEFFISDSFEKIETEYGYTFDAKSIIYDAFDFYFELKRKKDNNCLGLCPHCKGKSNGYFCNNCGDLR